MQKYVQKYNIMWKKLNKIIK